MDRQAVFIKPRIVKHYLVSEGISFENDYSGVSLPLYTVRGVLVIDCVVAMVL